ncbi:MAG: hypothetical protein DME26_18610, partial [Verrucomicrobia bacterium]
MAAPAVSGLLALMQEFFQGRLHLTNSPALMKALVINGARTVAQQYDLQVANSINYQGWGLVNISNTVPPVMANGNPSTWPTVFFDQSTTNALATGESHTRELTVTTNAQPYPLRVTLVWTDPPGNPAAGTKLVNDLDLVVTNLDTGEYYVGNNIPSGSAFTVASSTNSPAPPDMINNVENVFLNRPLGKSYSITVNARRVHVNAVTAHTNGIVQDYALVISSANGSLSNAFTISPGTTPPAVLNPNPPLTVVSNGVPLLDQRVGANSPLLLAPNGATNQWNFYTFTNPTNFTNVAIITFLPPDLSRPRFSEADIDLYVSRDSGLTNLDPAVIASASKSLSRGGTEAVVFSNSTQGAVYYIGVKSEDQQGANFGLFAIASQFPFGSRDADGNLVLQGVPSGLDIPDGSPDRPRAALVFAIGVDPVNVRRVVVENTITHESGGDLLGNLSHEQKFAVLNNHRAFMGRQTFIYDDSNQGDIRFSQPVDGPGSLRDFLGTKAAGVWQLTMVDNAPTQTGRVDNLTLRIEPQDDLTNAAGIVRTILPNRWFYTFVD